MKAPRTFFTAFLSLWLIALTGCTVKMVNQTPDIIPQNPSNIYTITMLLDSSNPNMIRDSLRVSVVINGETVPMTPAGPESNLFAADIELPLEQSQAVYYFVLDFDVKTSQGGTGTRQNKSNLFRFNLANRYIVSLESDRAPVGSTVPVMGRGFSRSDTIIVGSQPADTRFLSENLLEFVVPPLQAGTSYPVTWQSGLGDQIIGNFRIDRSNLIVRLERPVIRSGERAIIVFQIDFDAPAGGLLIQDTTDIPASIIMPEVVIPEGFRSVSVPVEGAEPGSGNLYFTVGGMNEVIIPITVTAM